MRNDIKNKVNEFENNSLEINIKKYLEYLDNYIFPFIFDVELLEKKDILDINFVIKRIKNQIEINSEGKNDNIDNLLKKLKEKNNKNFTDSELQNILATLFQFSQKISYLMIKTLSESNNSFFSKKENFLLKNIKYFLSFEEVFI